MYNMNKVGNMDNISTKRDAAKFIINSIKKSIPFDIDIDYDIDDGVVYIEVTPEISIEFRKSSDISDTFDVFVADRCESGSTRQYDHYEYDDVDDATKGVINIIENHEYYTDKYEIARLKEERLSIKKGIKTAIGNQKRQMEMISELMFHSETCTQEDPAQETYKGNSDNEKHEDNDKVNTLLKLQEQYLDILQSALEYKPDGEVVRSLEKHFGQLALSTKKD